MWLRRHCRIFAEERFLGAQLLRARAWIQAPLCALRRPGARSLRKAALCLRLAPRYTMVAPRLLFRLYDLTEETLRAGVPGSIVECGVWNGGSAATMAAAARAAGSERDLWLFDSFEGLPEPTERDPEPVRRHFYRGWNTGSEERVREACAIAGIPPSRVHVCRGWFERTFGQARVGSIAVLHLDCDWYEPVRLCLETWYDHVAAGGLVVLNDYGLYQGADDALHEFAAKRGLPLAIRPMGRVGAWFRKPGPGA